MKAEWVGAYEGEREIVAKGLWRLRRRWIAGSIGLAGTPLLRGGADGKNQGKRGQVVDGGVVLAARESDSEGKKEGEGLSSADLGL